jgi:hypothetical protein
MITILRCALIAVLYSIRAAAEGDINGDYAEIENTSFSACVHTNCDPKIWRYGESPQNGFRELILRSSSRNLFNPVGLYFEHIYNGTLADEDKSWYAPHRSPCHIKQLGPDSCQLVWKGAENPWNIDCTETFSLNGSAVDMKFEAVLNAEGCAPRGWLSFMWASYIDNLAIERNIHFYGIERGKWGGHNVLQWVNFGRVEVRSIDPENQEIKARVGTVRYGDAMKRKSEESVNRLNIEESGYRFVTPFYYGFFDEDHDSATTNDTMVYAMMLDRSEEMRLAAFDPRSQTKSPAWDWQFVLWQPEVGKKYEYNARLLVVPVTEILGEEINRENLVAAPPSELNEWVRSQWLTWVGSLPGETPNASPSVILEDCIIDATSVVNWPKGKEFVYPKAIAVDDFDGDITERIEIDATQVMAGAIGDYPLSYIVKDSQGKSSKRTITIQVRDKPPNPEFRIKFCCLSPLPWKKGKEFVPPKIVALSDVDVELHPDIRITRNEVDVTKLGIWQLAATATTPDGQIAEAVLPVEVREDLQNTSFEGPNPLLWRKGTPFTIPKATVWNGYGYDVETRSKIEVISNNVNINKTGNYEVIVQGTDSKGRISQGKLIVEVEMGFVYDALTWLVHRK